MSEQTSSRETHKQYFMSMVTMLTMSVMQQLGKLKDPVTGKTAVNLEAAQATIDMLDMLDAKTRGNLDEDEMKLLKDTLGTLKLNYVETAETEKKKGSAESPKQEPAEQDTNEQNRIETPDLSKEQKNPKFHKSYE